MTADLVSREILALRDSLRSTESEISKFDLFGYHSSLSSEEMVEALYIIWNLFNSVPLDSPTISLLLQEVDKRWLFIYLSRTRIIQVFFMHDILAPVSPAEIPSLVQFLSAFLLHLVEKDDLELADAATLSDLIVLTWWDLGFAAPSQYVQLSPALHDEFLWVLTRSEKNSAHLFTAISQFPEHANVFMTALLRLYVNVTDGFKTQLEPAGSLSAKSTPDPASRMLGIHPSVQFQQLHRVYEETLRLLTEKTPTILVGTNVTYTKSLYDSVVHILKKAVRCRSMVDSLHQRPDLPFNESEVKPTLVCRFARVRDYLLVRACRCLAIQSEAASPADSFPSQFSCLIRATAPKQLASRLLTASESLPLASSCSSAWDWDVEASESAISFAPHLELLYRSLDRGLNVLGVASWFVQLSDPKDVHLNNSLLFRLVKYASLLSTDIQFAFLLIVRIDHVRQLALPEQNYLKLLRAILSHLPTEAKIQLLTYVHSDKNQARASPLSRNSNQLESRMRLLFNRIVVAEEEGVDPALDGTKRNKQTPNRTTASATCDPEVLLDCELLLLTCPLLFLTELIRLPITRRCPSSRLAVHQLLNQLSYSLGISVTDSIRGSSRRRATRSLFQFLLLSDLISSHNSSDAVSTSNSDSLIADLDWDVVEDSVWHYEDMVARNESVVQPREPAVPIECAESVSSPLPIVSLTDPIVSTVVHLFKLASNEVIPLFSCLNQLLTESDSTEHNKWTIHVARIVHVLLLALGEWSVHASNQDCSLVLEQIIHLFVRCHASDVLENRCSDNLDTAGLLVSVMQKLINCSGTSVSVDSLQSVDDAITPKVGTGFRGFSYWILWSQAKRLLYDRIPVRTVEWNCEISVKRDLQRLVDWDQICDAFHLSTTNTSPVPTETPLTSDTISPRAFCALLRLSSVSDYSCEVVCGAAERMFKKDSKSWSAETLPVQNILLAVCVFLHAVSLTEQPLAWWRGFRLLDRLVNSDILWIPYRPRVDKQSHCSSEIYLVDWSKFRGSLDFLSLFADLIRIQTLSNDKVTYNVAMRFLCATLSTVLTRTLNRIGSIDDTRYRSVVQTQVRRTLYDIQDQLESAKKPLQSTRTFQADFERLRASLSASMTKLDTAP